MHPMKILITILTLIFTVISTSTSYAKWTKALTGSNGIDYIDLEKIRKIDGFVYYWIMGDYNKPTEYGYLSAKFYIQGDCRMFRTKLLSGILFKEPMGGGTGKMQTINGDWVYPPPDTPAETFLTTVCNQN